MPYAVRHGGGAGRIRADVVALDQADDASMSTPTSVFPEMMLPAPVVVPPIVAPDAVDVNAVIAVRHGGGAGRIRADFVALDQAATHRCQRRSPCFRR